MTNPSGEALAAVFDAPGLPLRLERFAIPEPGPAEAIVRIRCATVCGSDLHTFAGRRTTPSPCIPGHEMAGEIAALPDGGVRDYFGAGLAVGDRVTWSMLWTCGECWFCIQGLHSQCAGLRKFGHERIGSARQELFGGYAEYCHLPAGTAIFRIPADLADVVAAPSNCATATVAAAVRQAGRLEGARVVIAGAGMLGLTACAMAASGGAAAVVAIEPDPARRELARRFGATHTIDANFPPEEITEMVRSATGDAGACVSFELSGAPEAVTSAIGYLRPGGQLVLAGAVFPAPPAAVAAERVVRRMLRLTGVYNYSPCDLGTALAFLSRERARFPFEELAGAVFPLAEINRAVEYAGGRGRPPRVAIKTS